MSSSENVRCALVVTLRSSVPVTLNVHLPSGAGEPPIVPSQASACSPADSAPLASVTFAPLGPASDATTCEGRATR